MKFTKYSNPSKRRQKRRRRSPYSRAYIAERKSELNALLARAQSHSERDALVKAFDITINP